MQSPSGNQQSGAIDSSALVSNVDDAKHCKNGRQMSVCLGLTPQEYSSGGKLCHTWHKAPSFGAGLFTLSHLPQFRGVSQKMFDFFFQKLDIQSKIP
ncbi:MAG: transposase [Desulfovibrio sp.]|nr:transposase [Desulfovibrio sp.]